MSLVYQIIHYKGAGEKKKKKLASGELKDIPAAGKQEQTGGDPAEADTSDIHQVSYLSPGLIKPCLKIHC